MINNFLRRHSLPFAHFMRFKKGAYGQTLAGRPLYIFTLLMLCTLFSAAQTISPSTLNSTGQSASSGNFRFEWSVGEAAAIVTMSNGNLVVSSGVLQPFVSYQPASNGVSSWQAGEVKVYPNPTKDFIEINLLHHLSGRSKLELFDALGVKVMETQFMYNGNGRIEKWDLSKLAAGTYFLNVIQLSAVTGRPVKKGAFKILKIQ